jgi:hypothetical protein
MAEAEASLAPCPLVLFDLYDLVFRQAEGAGAQEPLAFVKHNLDSHPYDCQHVHAWNSIFRDVGVSGDACFRKIGEFVDILGNPAKIGEFLRTEG